VAGAAGAGAGATDLLVQCTLQLGTIKPSGRGFAYQLGRAPGLGLLAQRGTLENSVYRPFFSVERILDITYQNQEAEAASRWRAEALKSISSR
jgi:hypothetical protein